MSFSHQRSVLLSLLMDAKSTPENESRQKKADEVLEKFKDKQATLTLTDSGFKLLLDKYVNVGLTGLTFFELSCAQQLGLGKSQPVVPMFEDELGKSLSASDIYMLSSMAHSKSFWTDCRRAGIESLMAQSMVEMASSLSKGSVFKIDSLSQWEEQVVPECIPDEPDSDRLGKKAVKANKAAALERAQTSKEAKARKADFFLNKNPFMKAARTKREKSFMGDHPSIFDIKEPS